MTLLLYGLESCQLSNADLRSLHFTFNRLRYLWNCLRQRALMLIKRANLSLATKRSSVSRRWIRKDMFKKFHFRGHLPPKSEIESRSNRHLTQSRLQVTGCTAERYCLLHVVVQRPGSFQGRSTFLYDVRLRSYGASKLPSFRILAYFPHTKPPKTYLPVTSLAEWLRFFHVVVEGPMGCLLALKFSCDLC